MRFVSYRLADGQHRDPHVLWDPPREDRSQPEPGTFLVWVPAVPGVDLRTGMVVGVNGGFVHVVWNDWGKDPRIERGELKRRMGIPNAQQVAQARRARYRQKRAERELARKRQEEAGT